MKQIYCYFTILLLSGCATTATFTSIDLLETEEQYVEGVPFAVSTNEKMAVAMAPAAMAQSTSERPVFGVVIQNLSSNAITVGPENFLLVTDAEETLAAIPAEQLQREARRRAAWTKFGAGLQAASNSLNASSAGYSYGTTSFSANTTYQGTSGYGTATTTGIGTYSNYDSSAAAIAQANARTQNNILAEQTRAKVASMLASADAEAFQRQTILPGQLYQSLITFEKIPSSTQAIGVVFSHNEETHRFAWGYAIN